MHYYQFNISDYRKDTGHLTPVEHYIYRWLIDEYHLNHRPFTNNMPKLLRRMSVPESDRKYLESVLEEFFVMSSDSGYKEVSLEDHPEYAGVSGSEKCQYWVHPKMDKDIEFYEEKKEKQSAAGRASAEARRGKSNKRSSNDKQTMNQLITNNQEPITNKKNSRFKKPTLLELEEAFRKTGVDDPETEADKFLSFYESKGWMIGKNSMKSWPHAVGNWSKNIIKPDSQPTRSERYI